MPSSLIIVALVVAWLVVLVPMIARKRQEVAKTADSALASRVVRGAHAQAEDAEEELDMAHVGESETATPDEDEVTEQPEYYEQPRPYRPGRGGYDPEAAAATARAKYAFRQRVVLLLLLAAVVTGLVAGLALPLVWGAHGAVDLVLVGYLVYLRRQVRIEQEIRERRSARTRHLVEDEEYDEDGYEYEAEQHAEEPAEPEQLVEEAPRQSPPSRPVFRPRQAAPGTVVVDIDDEDPAFEDLDVPARRQFRRAVGE
ncbi:flagellar basal body-associated protein FliL [Kutzneria viridogrisea]|uniref:Uncharacterized protein n=2 Tax=Kutzneria TaxID=43356 RepID=W5W056_9PSEU|nr:gephyrin-like molybdotransferase receptor GlpR [Kutzneria albida]AHH94125.1 hypothetical protein KALB_750 [Kutzneria albida DSM 43870]MBA8929797.1 flagellar basal body-associated protein FliL [Kutzneria viridogrisea]